MLKISNFVDDVYLTVLKNWCQKKLRWCSLGACVSECLAVTLFSLAGISTFVLKLVVLVRC